MKRNSPLPPPRVDLLSILFIYSIPFLLLTSLVDQTLCAPAIEDEGPEGGCYYMFNHYGEGDRILTNEPCLNCTCHNSMLMCYLRVCPFTKPIGQDCTIEKKPDQCCPVISCPEVPVSLVTPSASVSSTTAATTTSLSTVTESTEVAIYERGCNIEGKFYSDGAQIEGEPSKPCELCYCIRNRTACVMQECILHVEGCEPVFQPGVCCPVRYRCDYPLQLPDETTTTLSGLLTTTLNSIFTSTLPSVTGGCTRDGVYYNDGSQIPGAVGPCEHCYCMRGEIVCAVQECGAPLENEGGNCTAIPPPPGMCCPEKYSCEGDTVSEVPVTTLPQAEDLSDIPLKDESPTTLPPQSMETGLEGDVTTEASRVPDQEPEAGVPAADATERPDEEEVDRHTTASSQSAPEEESQVMSEKSPVGHQITTAPVAHTTVSSETGDVDEGTTSTPLLHDGGHEHLSPETIVDESTTLRPESTSAASTENVSHDSVDKATTVSPQSDEGATTLGHVEEGSNELDNLIPSITDSTISSSEPSVPSHPDVHASEVSSEVPTTVGGPFSSSEYPEEIRTTTSASTPEEGQTLPSSSIEQIPDSGVTEATGSKSPSEHSVDTATEASTEHVERPEQDDIVEETTTHLVASTGPSSSTSRPTGDEEDMEVAATSRVPIPGVYATTSEEPKEAGEPTTSKPSSDEGVQESGEGPTTMSASSVVEPEAMVKDVPEEPVEDKASATTVSSTSDGEPSSSAHPLSPDAVASETDGEEVASTTTEAEVPLGSIEGVQSTTTEHAQDADERFGSSPPAPTSSKPDMEGEVVGEMHVSSTPEPAESLHMHPSSTVQNDAENEVGDDKPSHDAGVPTKPQEQQVEEEKVEATTGVSIASPTTEGSATTIAADEDEATDPPKAVEQGTEQPIPVVGTGEGLTETPSSTASSSPQPISGSDAEVSTSTPAISEAPTTEAAEGDGGETSPPETVQKDAVDNEVEAPTSTTESSPVESETSPLSVSKPTDEKAEPEQGTEASPTASSEGGTTERPVQSSESEMSAPKDEGTVTTVAPVDNVGITVPSVEEQGESELGATEPVATTQSPVKTEVSSTVASLGEEVSPNVDVTTMSSASEGDTDEKGTVSLSDSAMPQDEDVKATTTVPEEVVATTTSAPAVSDLAHDQVSGESENEIPIHGEQDRGTSTTEQSVVPAVEEIGGGTTEGTGMETTVKPEVPTSEKAPHEEEHVPVSDEGVAGPTTVKPESEGEGESVNEGSDAAVTTVSPVTDSDDSEKVSVDGVKPESTTIAPQVAADEPEATTTLQEIKIPDVAEPEVAAGEGVDSPTTVAPVSSVSEEGHVATTLSPSIGDNESDVTTVAPVESTAGPEVSSSPVAPENIEVLPATTAPPTDSDKAAADEGQAGTVAPSHSDEESSTSTVSPDADSDGTERPSAVIPEVKIGSGSSTTPEVDIDQVTTVSTPTNETEELTHDMGATVLPPVSPEIQDMKAVEMGEGDVHVHPVNESSSAETSDVNEEEPGEGYCFVEGKTYPNNSKIPPTTPCHLFCQCRNSIVHCLLMQCNPPPSEPSDCKPVYQKGVCCPTFDCDSREPAAVTITPGPIAVNESEVVTVTPEPPVLLSTTTLSSSEGIGEAEGSTESPSVESGSDESSASGGAGSPEDNQAEDAPHKPAQDSSEEEDGVQPLTTTTIASISTEVSSSELPPPVPQEPEDEEHSSSIHAQGPLDTVIEKDKGSTESPESIVHSSSPVSVIEDILGGHLVEEGQVQNDTASSEDAPPSGSLYPVTTTTTVTPSSAVWPYPTSTPTPSSVMSTGACLFDGRVFMSAQQIPRDDPCDFCFCFRGDIICLQQSCPPPIPGCYEEPIPGFCCPRYECPVGNGNSTTQAPPYPPSYYHNQLLNGGASGGNNASPNQGVANVPLGPGCEVQGEYYESGQLITATSGPCLECRCGLRGMMECEPRVCQPEPMLRKMIAAISSRR